MGMSRNLIPRYQAVIFTKDNLESDSMLSRGNVYQGQSGVSSWIMLTKRTWYIFFVPGWYWASSRIYKLLQGYMRAIHWTKYISGTFSNESDFSFRQRQRYIVPISRPTLIYTRLQLWKLECEFRVIIGLFWGVSHHDIIWKEFIVIFCKIQTVFLVISHSFPSSKGTVPHSLCSLGAFWYMVFGWLCLVSSDVITVPCFKHDFILMSLDNLQVDA